MEVKVRIVAKKSDNKAFKASDDSWYNVNTPVIPYLEKMGKGDEVVVTFEKKGTSRYVSLLTLASAKTETTSTAETTSEFKCEVCGKTLKDGKYKVCFTCNKAGLSASKAAPATTAGKSYNNYNDPAKTAQIQRGNALNAAASAASGCAFSDPSTAAQFVRELADSLLDWLRLE